MKNIILTAAFVAMIVFTPFDLGAREPDTARKIEINFGKKTVEYKTLQEIKKGDSYRVIISDINLYMYNISIYAKDTTTSPALTFPTFSTFNLDVINKAIESLLPFGSVVSRAVTIAANNELEQTQSFQWMNEPSILAALYVDSSIHSFEKDYVIFREKLDLLRDTLGMIKNDFDNIVWGVQQAVISAQLLANSTAPNTSPIQVMSDLTKIRVRILHLENSWKASNAAATTQLKALKEQYGKMNVPDKAKYKTLLEEFEKLVNAYTAFNTNLGEAKVSADAKNCSLIVAPLISIANNSARTYTSFPITYHGDNGIIKIVITPAVKDVTLPSWRIEIRFPEYPQTYAGVSSGIFVSTLFDDAYSVKSLTDTTFELRPEQKSRCELGVNSLMVFGWHPLCMKNTPTYFHGALGLGLAISNKVSPRFMLGVGISHGDRHKFVLTGGILGGYVSRLSKVYFTNDTYSSKPENFMVSKLEGGFFASVGYAFAF